MVIEENFTNIGSFVITSPEATSYNCIAWAAGDTTRWWDVTSDGYWPEGTPRRSTLGALVAAFQSQGYEVCDDSSLEEGYHKVALYADTSGDWTHAARQLANGEWTSKLGVREDIEHEAPSSLEGALYGRVALVMKRPILGM